MLIREHRGGLEESKATGRHICNNRAALTHHVIQTMGSILRISPREISVAPYVVGKCNFESVYLVKIEGYGVFGYLEYLTEDYQTLNYVPFYPELINRYRQKLLESPDFGVASKTDRIHLLWMLDQLDNDDQQSLTKKHRWLGFIQGCMVMYNLLEVDEEREHTRHIFDGA